MQASQLKPASTLSQRFGVKAVLYGGPGTGKTPMISTAPKAVMCVVEPGMLSMRTSNVPCWEAYTADKIEEFVKWLLTSAEAKNYDTAAFDSLSQVAEVILTQELGKCKDGRMAYGNMSRRVMQILNDLYYLPQKHIVMIAKQASVENGRQTVMENGAFTVEMIMQKRPYFPGQDLNIKVPHLFDEVLNVGSIIMPGQPKPVTAIRTRETADYVARDRSGRLDEIEEPNLTKLFSKAMS